MRKKKHKSINPNNRDFDRFYIINYLVRFVFDFLKKEAIYAKIQLIMREDLFFSNVKSSHYERSVFGIKYNP